MGLRDISLAQKCQLLFAGAVVVIVMLALAAPWFRVGSVVDQAHTDASRQFASLWASEHLGSDAALAIGKAAEIESADGSRCRARYVPWFDWEKEAAAEPAGSFVAAARKAFDSITPGQRTPAEWIDARNDDRGALYRFASVQYNTEGQRAGVLLIERRSMEARGVVFRSRVVLFVAALLAAALGLVAFHFITTRLILEPVRRLRETAELVRSGNLNTRSDIHTGDEFEELAEAFNSMLTDLQSQQQQMRGINRSLDLELTKLAERNLALYEAARLKGEFLARVSHELRTPMNAIIGFAELLQETAAADRENPTRAGEPDRVTKRAKYLNNILSAGRTLLEMINDLLAMARIEAGNIEVSVQEVSVAESCEGLLALIRPLADKKSIRLTLHAPSSESRGSDPELPIIRTDPKKFEQIVFNFLSNAVKFTPEHGEVTLRAERLRSADGVGRVRVSVLDTGPGIPADQHAFVFERFTQIDGSRTREHQGTGLGLAIAKEFAELLQGEIQLVSESGRGSMFSLILPLELDEAAAKEAASRVIGRVRERGHVGVA